MNGTLQSEGLQRFHRRNRAYYDDLNRLHQVLVASGLRVLEIGCGLGDVQNLLDLACWEVLKQGHRGPRPRRLPLLGPLANRWLVTRPATPAQRQPSVSVVIPARDEAGNIATAIERMPLLGSTTEMLVVEGHSSDDTWAEIERVCAAYSCPLLLRALRQSSRGKADAVWLGFDQDEGEVLMILDADLTVPPEDLPRFYKALAEGRGEFVNGCRLVYPRTSAAMPPLNTAANRFFAAAFSWLLRQRLKDTLCGTKVIWKADHEFLKAEHLVRRLRPALRRHRAEPQDRGGAGAVPGAQFRQLRHRPGRRRRPCR